MSPPFIIIGEPRVAYHRGYYRQRYAYYRPAFPGFLFGIFHW